MVLKSLDVFIPEPLIVFHSVPRGTELRSGAVIAAFSIVTLIGHEADIVQDGRLL